MDSSQDDLKNKEEMKKDEEIQNLDSSQSTEENAVNAANDSTEKSTSKEEMAENTSVTEENKPKETEVQEAITPSSTVVEEIPAAPEAAEVTVSEALTDEELEKEDDTKEVHSDEDDHDEHEHHELELPDYAEYEKDALIAEAERLIKNEPIQKIKNHIESLRKHLLKQLNEERQAKLKEFIEGGGVEMDFEYIQPRREKFRNIFSEYRTKRQKHYQVLQDELESNLKTKLEIIEHLKVLVTKDESIGDTFKEFNALQQEWRNTGPVPRNESDGLWRTYHHHVENFYEYIKINKELRDLDFKKNLEAKEALIQRTEKLLEVQSIKDAFKQLQDIHKKWKNIGPVDRDHREPMWERFSQATKNLHQKREEYYANLREKSEELLLEKKKYLEELKNFDIKGLKNHRAWQDAIKAVDKIRENFKGLGRLNHPENDKIWDEFRNLLHEFNHAKNQFYKNIKKEHNENLAKKMALVELAEKLKDSEDWSATTNEMKRIQAQWKTIGHVPKSESDKIWKRFRGACNHFFDRLTENNKSKDEELMVNFTAKQAELEKLKAYEPKKDDQKNSVKELKAAINTWKGLGRVPRSKAGIETEFSKVLDEKFKAIDMDRKESVRIRFENKMETMTDGQDDRALANEKHEIRRQIEESQKEIDQLETNLSFFSSSPNSPLLKDVHNNIKKQKEQLELLKEKLKMVTVKIREINKPSEESENDSSAEQE